MPVILVFGVPRSVGTDAAEELISKIQEAVAKVPVLNIPANEVSVFCRRILLTVARPVTVSPANSEQTRRRAHLSDHRTAREAGKTRECPRGAPSVSLH